MLSFSLVRRRQRAVGLGNLLPAVGGRSGRLLAGDARRGGHGLRLAGQDAEDGAVLLARRWLGSRAGGPAWSDPGDLARGPVRPRAPRW